ncbi:hypothetical protein GCM10023187_31120 [Nibrella viscosa]|uniref:BioF2-like acetyltransferase domain-containing protein n=1 Tax=Nibrella viscosa TaxID=1084524 RepID=A0ABP8KKP6_9BACT
MAENLGDEYEVRCLTTAAETVPLPPFSFDVFLYLQPEHVALQAGPDWQMYVLLNKQTAQIDGLAHFFRENALARSPWRAPFGGVQLRQGLPEITATAFLHHLQLHLWQQGIRQVQWLQCPDAYAPETNKWLRAVLPGYGYTLQYNQLNHHIPVTESPFTANLHDSLRRRLRKCRKAGFLFQQEAAVTLPEAYAFIKRCRDEKQKPLSLSLDQLSRYFDLFPDRYFLFTVRTEGELAAVGVAVLVTQGILNHLYPASPKRFNTYSPSVLLNAGLYTYCQSRHISMLDLGVSAPVQEREEDYSGLFTFKERLGGLPSWKPAFLNADPGTRTSPNLVFGKTL